MTNCLCCFHTNFTWWHTVFCYELVYNAFYPLLDNFACGNRNSCYWNVGEEGRYHYCAISLPLTFLQIWKFTRYFCRLSFLLCVFSSSTVQGVMTIHAVWSCASTPLLKEWNKADSVFEILLVEGYRNQPYSPGTFFNTILSSLL